MNAGAAHVRRAADVLLFLHADTRLPADADRLIAAAIARGLRWGRFDVRISGRSPWLGVVARADELAVALSGICTGDQAIFVGAQAVRDARRLPRPAVDGGHRFLTTRAAYRVAGRAAAGRDHLGTPLGATRRRAHRSLQMWSLRWRYYRGVDPAVLARDYREVR